MTVSEREEVIPKAGFVADIHDYGERYRKSYRRLRLGIGILGVFLPLALLLGDGFFLQGDILPRGSLSAYYHSPMRDLFVGALSSIGIFLITYRVAKYKLDNRLTTVAGLAALVVALFPTARPDDDVPQTALQEMLTEDSVHAIHLSAAAIFIGLLAAIGYYFGRREYRKVWQRFHWGCAAVIVLAVVFIVFSKSTGWLSAHSLLIGETVAVFAFGFSWLIKGHALDILHARSSKIAVENIELAAGS